MVLSHVLEKGITMPKRRLGFGYDRVRSIIRLLKKSIENYSENHIEIQSALNDLEQYYQMHESEKFKLPDDIDEGIKELLRFKTTETIACFESTPNELFKQTDNFYDFAHSRHTVRWYSDETIDCEIIKKAVELAQTAPSACNRQSTNVYVVDTKHKKDEIFNIQNGSRGFGHLADKWILITTDMRCWGYTDRRDAYLDAGIFTQNLLYALHYYHICACTLNANMKICDIKRLRKIIGFSQSEIPVVFIAIGKAPEHFMVAGSQRINTVDICRFV
jgi:nitroreductase